MISKEEALQIAKKTAEEKKWPFDGEVKVELLKNKPNEEHREYWFIKTNADKLGGSVEVIVDNNSSEVISSRLLPR